MFDRLQPFDRIGAGEGKVDRVASTRRLVDKDGKVHRPRWSLVTGKDLPLRNEPEGLIDPMLKTITLAQGAKPLVRMHYYASHPQSFYHEPRVTYDFPGMAREESEKKEGVFQVYLTGCAGDVLVGKHTDLGPGYLCTDNAFEEGGYEPTDTAVGPGSEPVLKAAIVKLLGAKNSSQNPVGAAVVAHSEAGLGASPK